MRRKQRAFVNKDPLDRATNVSLPSFNFVEPQSPQTPRKLPTTSAAGLPKLNQGAASRQRNAQAPTPAVAGAGIDFDEILYFTIAKWATQMKEPSLIDWQATDYSMAQRTQESKMARIWQSMLRHSEVGRFGHSNASPNRICSALCLEIIRQILETCGVSTLLREVLVGGLANSIYFRYDQDLPYSSQQQHADVAHEQQLELDRRQQEIDDLKEEQKSKYAQANQQLTAAALVLKKMDSSLRLGTIAEMISPFLCDDLFLVLWNTMATSRAMEQIDGSISSPIDETISEEETVELSIEDTQKRASALANLVLQERARLVMTFWHTLSVEEQKLLYKSFQSNKDNDHDSATLKTVLHALEETYMAEQIHHRRQTTRQKLMLGPGSAHPSESLHPETPQGVAGPQFRRPTMTIRRRLVSNFAILDHQPRPPHATGSTDPNPTQGQAISIPDVLLGVIGSRPYQKQQGTKTLATNNVSLEQLKATHEAMLRKCEEVFDLLCEEDDDTEQETSNRHKSASRADGEDQPPPPQSNVREAKRSLCDLLCTYLEPTDEILEKYSKSEEALEKQRLAKLELDDGSGANTFVQTVVQKLKQNPALLVNAINQSPEILLSAVAQNLGILRFTITKFAGPVKRFLKLDPKACDHIDGLVQKNRGVQLLWGTHTSTADTVTGVGNASIDEYLAAAGGTVGGAGIGYLVDWYTSHSNELAALFLRQPELLKQLFVDMHQQADVSSFYKLMLQLQTAAGVQNFMRRASVATLERIAQEDPGEILRLLREVFQEDHNGPNHDLLDQLRSSQYLVTCLSEFHPTALQDILSSHTDTWKHYFVDAAASNDTILRESLLLRTENVEGGDALVKIFDAVVDGTTAKLNLQSIDFTSSPGDIARAKERESSTRRKMQQCLYLRGITTVFRAFISPQIASVGYHPRSFMDAGTTAASSSPFYLIEKPKESKETAKAPIRTRGKRLNGHNTMGSTSPKKRHHRVNITKDEIAEIAAAAFDHDGQQFLQQAQPPLDLPQQEQQQRQPPSSQMGIDVPAEPQQSQSPSSQVGIDVPSMWQTYLRAFYRHQSDKQHAPITLTKAHVKTLILDVWIEFLKADHLQLENACLWTIAPFVCDYFINRYESPVLVGCWLYSFVEGLLAFQDDPRIAFFCAACGLTTSVSSPGYDVFLYYLHALGHILFGQMKIFKSENRLEETADGGCPVPLKHIAATANILFQFTLTTTEMHLLQQELEALSVVTRPQAPTDEMAEQGGEQPEEARLVELDDVMAVFLTKWIAMNQLVDERYKQAFEQYDTGSNRIGLGQFIQVVTSVTNSRISPRECRLVFGDVGHESMDLEMVLRVTRAYQLRLFNTHLPEVPFQEQDLQELRLSVGRTNISSVEREVEDLVRYWRSVHGDLARQLEASHQNKATKALLRKQNALIERMLRDIQQHAQHPQRSTHNVDLPSTLNRAWQEIRACVKMLHTAKLTQHYLSRLFLQSSLVKWIRQARMRAQGEERKRTLEQLTS